MTYVALVQSLHPSLNRHNTAWVRGIQAKSLTEACKRATEAHPNLGCTPTTVSMAWPVWPQPHQPHQPEGVQQ